MAAEDSGEDEGDEVLVETVSLVEVAALVEAVALEVIVEYLPGPPCTCILVGTSDVIVVVSIEVVVGVDVESRPVTPSTVEIPGVMRLAVAVVVVRVLDDRP